MTDIIMQAYQVAESFANDPDVITLKQLNKEIDRLYPREIDAFNQAKAMYTDVMAQGGHYHPDFKTVTVSLSKSKALLYEKVEVQNYLKLEKIVEDKLNDFLKEMTHRISSHIPTPNALGIVKKGGSCHVG